MIPIESIIKLSNEYEQQTISIRRELHKYPELAFNEHQTSKLIIRELESLGIEIIKGLVGTGVMGIIKGKPGGKVILLRAEMDALPIDEDLDIEFKSQNKGIMHACGHDVHIANLLGAAKILLDLKDQFSGTVKFLFQPGEEKGGGAKKMIAEGILENPKVDAAIGMHIIPIEKGQILISTGNITAYSDGFTIKVRGKKAHTSKPEDGVDAINIAAHIVVALNSIISKNLDPNSVSTFSVGKISGGISNNIVPDYVELGGMIRAVTKESRDIIRNKIESISKGITSTFGGECSIEIREGYPSIFNNKELTKKIKILIKENISYLKEGTNVFITEHKPLLTADDFGFIASKVPSTYYMVGTGDHAPAHSSNFFVDEDYIKLCTRTMTIAALEALKD